MKYWRSGRAPGGRALAGVLIAAMALTGLVRAAELPNIRHRPIEYYVPGHRVEVLTSVSDESGVDVVRCYFRQKGSPTFLFVDMQPVGGDQYRGVLPAADGSGEIEYRFLVLTGGRCLFTTGAFTMAPATEQQAQDVPRWQQVPEGDALTVMADETTAPLSIPGFDDVLSMTATPPDQQLGKATDMHGPAPAADSEDRRAGGALADFIFCGAIPAAAISAGALVGGGGFSTGAIIAGGAAIAGGVTAGVLATGGGGGDGGGGGGIIDPVSGTCPVQMTVSDSIMADTDPNPPVTVDASAQLGAHAAQVIGMFYTLTFDPQSIEGETNNFQVTFAGQTDQTGSTFSSGSQSGTIFGTASQATVDVQANFLADPGGYSWSIFVDFFCQQAQVQ